MITKQKVLNGISKVEIKKPSLIDNIRSYEQEYDIWVENGKPTRSIDRIKELFDKYCSNCEHYTGKKCDICGCMINKTKGLNKLFWATTKCADNPPKFTEDLPKKEGLPEAKKPQQTPKNRHQNKKKKNKGGKGCGC